MDARAGSAPDPVALARAAGDPEAALDVLVVGAGQAGLAIGHHLGRADLRFLLVDQGAEVGATWSSRWDSLRLFSPAQYDALPGMAFPAPDDTYPNRAEVADYLRAYAERFALPVLLGTRVERLASTGSGFAATTSAGPVHARQVVVATGPFQSPATPAVAAGLDDRVGQVHSADYRNPDVLPAGEVVVVGSGNSGRQIALELAASRSVTLAEGAASLQLPQRLLGRDLFWWLTRFGVMRKTGDSRLAQRMQQRGDLVIGTPMRDLRRAGVTVRPRVTAASGDTLTFADGSEVRPAAVVWATGFRSDYSWIEVPGVVTDGRVQHRRGLTDVPGISFIGLPWQHTRGSALLGFVRDDAAYVSEHVVAAAGPTARLSSNRRPAQ